jgi:hypothetical protein
LRDLDLRDVFQERVHGVKRDLPVIPLISQNLAKLKYAKKTKQKELTDQRT